MDTLNRINSMNQQELRDVIKSHKAGKVRMAALAKLDPVDNFKTLCAAAMYDTYAEAARAAFFKLVEMKKDAKVVLAIRTISMKAESGVVRCDAENEIKTWPLP